ncbi:MAG: hypothetical protein LBS36_01420 [Oscillospiraceae bacterium]|nr:hypothetical protein [Oscillospiraceae bacterium]
MTKKRTLLITAVVFFLIGTMCSGMIGFGATYLFGDIDGDGKITAADARKLLRASAKLETLVEPEWEEPTQPEPQKYSIGETVSVKEGAKTLYTLKINSATLTDYRNPYADKDPEQVVIIDYTYENVASTSEIYISSSNFKVIDGDKNVCSTYPALVSDSPKYTPVRARCTAQAAYGLDSDKNTFTLLFYAEFLDDQPVATFDITL